MKSPFQGGWKRLMVLVRREFWEHRSLLWLPVAVCALHFILALGLVLVPRNGMNIQMEMRQEQSTADSLGGVSDTRVESTSLNWNRMSTASLLDLVAATPREKLGHTLDRLALGHAHLLAAMGSFLMMGLFSLMVNKERQNRSSLFFLSMPLPPWTYLGGKLATGALALALVWGTVVISQTLGLLVFSATALAHGHAGVDLFWGSAHFPRLWAVLAAQLLVDTLWALPLFGSIALVASLGWSGRGGRYGVLLLGAAVATVVDRLYLTGGGLWLWMTRHLPPPAFNWEHRGLDTLRALQGRAPALGEGTDLVIGAVLGLLLLMAAARTLHWREET
jgi:hypothetical protein